MTEKKAKPQIRFAGFSDTWEQRKLGDVIEVSTRRNGNTYTKEDVLSVSDEYGCVNQIRFQGRSFAGEDISNYKIVDTGDIIYTRSPLQAKPYGIIKLVTAETGIVSPLYIVNKSIKGNDSEFIYRVFDSPHKTNYYLNPLVRKGAKNTMNISEDEWLSGEVIVSPNYEEQVTIGRFFRNLDTLITLHQRKLDKLTNVKKSMLEKMFPKNGANVPEIRFKGFTDPWEQRKFEEAFIERREKTEQENEDTLLSCAINGMFLNSELFGHFRGTTTIGYLRVKKNDLILSAQNLHLGNANVNLRFEHGIISPAYKVYDLNNCDPEFVQAWVKKDDTKNFFLAATTEGASQCRKNIEWETLGKQTISMPSMEEQKKIGAFFTTLDHLITLHQRKLEKLKNIKKACLEKMFI